MALLLCCNSCSSSLSFNKNLSSQPSLLSSSKFPTSLFFFFNKRSRALHFTPSNPFHQKRTFRFSSSLSEPAPEPDPNPTPNPNPNPDLKPTSTESPSASSVNITDEWGEKVDPEPEYTSAADADPPKDEDEWEEEYASVANSSAGGVVSEKDGTIADLKRCLVDTVDGTNFGFQASPEVRGEVLELVNQLEALNPTPAPVEASRMLDGNWILLYTAFSELLPLLAVGSLPSLKVEKISQAVDTGNLSIVNFTTLSSPFATLSFSASASFEVRSSSRIQVEFKEGTLQPPEIKPRIDLPGNIDVFGQNINLLPVQQSLNPLQELVANISRTISGQPPLKIPIPGERSKSWLLITYLDEDLRISRGDGGLFVLIKEGSPLLD